MWTLVITAALALGSGPTRELPDPEVPAIQESSGLLIRIGGDVEVPRGQHIEGVVAIGGDAHVQGAADRVLVIDGVADLDGAQVGGLVVIDGRAALRGATVVTGDVTLVDSTIERDPGAVIVGAVKTRTPWRPFGFWVSGLLLPLGLVIAFVLGGLAVAALAPAGVGRAEAALTGEVGKTLLSSLLVWVVVPLGIAISLAYVVTIPAGIGVLLFVLPALGFFGYVITGLRIGDAVLGAMRRPAATPRLYWAALVGIPLLFAVGMVPVVGALVTLLAGIAGGGAIVLVAWRTVAARRTA